MNLLLFSAEDLIAPGRIGLGGRRLEHITGVLGAACGDSLRVGELGGRLGQGRIVALDRRQVQIEFQLDSEPPAKLPVTLVVALPRPKMLRRILRAVAEFGVGELYLVNSYRVEKSYWQTPVLQAATLREYLLQGLEQGRDTILPAVHCERRFKPFVEDRLPAICLGRNALLAHPGPASAPLPADPAGHSVVAIGPEGGFIDYEVQKLVEAGFTPAALGPRILRVENAIGAVLGRLLNAR